MKRAMPLDDQMNISSDESLSSEPDIAELAGKFVEDIPTGQPTDIVMTTGNCFPYPLYQSLI